MCAKLGVKPCKNINIMHYLLLHKNTVVEIKLKCSPNILIALKLQHEINVCTPDDTLVSERRINKLNLSYG